MGYAQIGIGEGGEGRDRERAGIKTNYTHPVHVNILVALPLPCSSQAHADCLYLAKGVFLKTGRWRLFPLIMVEHIGAGRPGEELSNVASVTQRSLRDKGQGRSRANI